ncbi:MAG: glycosyltransferase family 39 protein [Acidobacteriota bacterium]|nr:glycosyltransferase family 39 protein [Acidobacteriota bacterium]
MRRPALLAGLLALFATVVGATLGQRVFGGVPHAADGISYSFQGKIFAAGRPWLEPPPVPEAFKSQNVLLDGTRWCGIYPPGFPLLLAAGWLVGAPFLVNPVLLGLAVFGVFRLGRALFDESTGLLGSLFLAVSPFALLMGAGFMGHVAALCVFTWCLAFLAESGKDGATGASRAARPLISAGFLGCFGIVVRPQAAVFFLLPALVSVLIRRRTDLARTAGWLALGGAAPLGFLLAYNFALSGHPLRMAYLVWDPNLSFTYGFSSTQLFASHFPWFASDLNATVWGYPWGDLLFLLLLLIPAPRRRWDAWLFASVLGLVVGFSFYRFYEINHSGPRYAFEALGALALLAARSCFALEGLVTSLFRRFRLERLAPAAAVLAVAFLAIFPLATLLPRQAEALSHAYHAHTGEPLRRLAAAGVGPSALVLVAGNTVEWTYGSFLLANGLDPRTAPRVFVRDLPERRAELLAAYPRREVWRVNVTLEPQPHPNAWIDNTWDVVDAVWLRLR